MRKSILTLSVAAALSAPMLVAAQSAPAPRSPVTGNIALVSEYRFRGIDQTFGEPALQGGFDYAHSSGVYLGNWNSNVGALFNGANLEMDFYGGWRKSFGDFGLDVGAIYYYY
ncbi:MAG TPA: TorF family putative porin, partial [Burkholderiales bacterium]|nr:TorF family putative porin [Burkholderiales bacterium]